MVQWISLLYVIVAFSGHTHFFFMEISDMWFDCAASLGMETVEILMVFFLSLELGIEN